VAIGGEEDGVELKPLRAGVKDEDCLAGGEQERVEAGVRISLAGLRWAER
jgi:hypothetical protein